MYGLNKDKVKIKGPRLLELFLGPMQHQLYPPPVVQSSIHFQEPAACVASPARNFEVTAINSCCDGDSRLPSGLSCVAINWTAQIFSHKIL